MRTIWQSIFLFSLASSCWGLVSTNVPLGHFSYDAIEKLVGQGLIDSAMLNTRPMTRLEMARLVAEAIENSRQHDKQNEITLQIIERLKNEFRNELVTMGILDGNLAECFIKPVEDPYFKYVYADEKPDLENQRGDVFERKSNYRLGFSSRMSFFNTIAIFLHPEYTESSLRGDSEIELIEGYGKIAIGSFEIQAGKDSMWWGPGKHGSILMSNNAEPLKMVKISNSRPLQLPWIFRGFGLFKAVWFLSELEKERTIPKVKLTGVRLSFKPHPSSEIGLSRTIMFDGSGRPDVGIRDYIRMFEFKREQAENNQLAGFDFSTQIPVGEILPLKSIKMYGDLAGEDEAGGLPIKWGILLGIQLNDILQTGRTDLRIEYADNHVSGYRNIFYKHLLYRSGYTYKGRVIGHHMGTDSRDVFLRLTHYLTKDVILGLEYDKQATDFVLGNQQSIEQLGVDLTVFTTNGWQVKTGYRYENAQNNPVITEDNHIFLFQLTYNF